jgi:beta-galactosidase GanA
MADDDLVCTILDWLSGECDSAKRESGLAWPRRGSSQVTRAAEHKEIGMPRAHQPSTPGSRDHTAGGLSRRALLGGAAVSAAGLAVGLPRTTAQAGAAFAAGPRVGHAITFDRYSLMIDGRRLVVWSGEMHPFRLPSPSLWRDVLQKFKANGYNAVTMYFNWSYHSPAPGVYDFSGVRDMDAVLDMAAETGLYVLARPGPYINAEVNAGGFPGWLTSRPGTARSADPAYLAFTDEWQTAIDAVLARHQLTDGGGTVLLYQIENEFSARPSSSNATAYMAHLYAKARADGITVPIYHNDKGRTGDWVPDSFPAPDDNYLYAFDGYPSPTGTPPDWGYFGSGGATGGSTASPDTPGFEAEFGGGWFDPWGDATMRGEGYAYERALAGPAYERTFYLTNIANGITIHSVYMTFGGTSWGWMPAPVVYTSYDYGAAFDEARQATDKVPPMKQLGYFLSSVADVTRLDPAEATTASDPSVKVYHLSNAETGAHLYLYRNDHTDDVTFSVPVETSTGQRTVPVAGSLSLAGKDMKVLLAGYRMGGQRLVYTTSHVMTHAGIGDQDVAVLTGRPGDSGETVLAFDATPRVATLAGAVTADWDAAAGELRLDYTHGGLTRVLVRTGGARSLLVLIADDDTAADVWRHDTEDGAVLAIGPALLRGAGVRDGVLELSGDTTAGAALEVWAAPNARALRWNGHDVAASRTASGSLRAREPLAGPPTITLPELTGWRYAPENPEALPGFDDRGWRPADATTSASSTPVPAGQPVLFVDDYGFHYGDVWYRGHWSGASEATSVDLAYQSGTVGMLQAWADGQYLGAHQMPTPTSAQATTQAWSATASFPLPRAVTGGGDHVLAVLMRSMAHQEDGGGGNAFKGALGLTAVTFAGGTPTVSWRIQGTLGGEQPADPVRGPLNTGGLYGERHGWHLPGFPTVGWQPVSLPYADGRPGVAWYRTTFRLAVPEGVDASLGLTLTDDPARRYRALIFVNGWNLGQYVNDVGPQHSFVLPNGIIDPRGENTLALAVTSADAAGGLGRVALADLGTAAGGVPLRLVASPAYRRR